MNRRIIISETQQRIIDAFFLLAQKSQDPKKITFTQIAEKAEIKRQNIYKKHFKNMDDLLNTIHMLIDWECEQKFEEVMKDDATDLIACLTNDILPILFHNRAYLKVLYGTMADSDWTNFLQKKYAPIIKMYLNRKESLSGLSLEFISNLIVRQILAIIANWLTSEEPDPVSLFKKRFLLCLSTSTSDLLTKTDNNQVNK